MITYFLYTRKSTDVEDKQVRSIEDQLAVLRALAKQEGFSVAHEFIEKQSAKMPGRPVFGEMMERIENGEAQGVLCWKLDRLARNPIDGGQISWFLQRGILQNIQTHDRSYRPTDNVLTMSVEFGMANQYILDLSANTKRGLHEKVKRGEYPSQAPLGYINDSRIKRIVKERKTAKIVVSAFTMYAEGNSRLEDISQFFFEHGIKTRPTKRWGAGGGKPYCRDKITAILSNPFYIGLFRYTGEMHEGKHEPIISKKLFDGVQAVLKDRGKPHKKPVNEPQPLCGLFRCGECGASITAENRTKRQKNGNEHHYVYYRCTKKIRPCSQAHIRDGELVEQLSRALSEYALPSDWADELSLMADKDEAEATNVSETASQAMREDIERINEKLQRLLTAYLDQDIEQEIYRREKAELLSRKKSLEEVMAKLQKGGVAWLEPLRKWIKDSVNAGETAVSPDLFAKKSSALNLSCSNPYLQNKKIVFVPSQPSASLREARAHFSENASIYTMVPPAGIEPACPVRGKGF